MRPEYPRPWLQMTTEERRAYQIRLVAYHDAQIPLVVGPPSPVRRVDPLGRVKEVRMVTPEARRQQYRESKARKVATLCWASKCLNEAMEPGGLCGFHDEAQEDGEVIKRKTRGHHSKDRDYAKQAENRAKNTEARKKLSRDAAREVIEEIKARKQGRAA